MNDCRTNQAERSTAIEGLRACAELMRARAPELWSKPLYAGRILPLDDNEGGADGDETPNVVAQPNFTEWHFRAFLEADE